MYSVEPETGEGQLVRAARTSKRLTMKEAAELLGISDTTLGYIERGRRGSSRHVPPAAELARISAKLGIPAGELARIGRQDAADLLGGFPAPPDGGQPGPDADAADDFFEALTRDRPDREVMWRLWYRSFDAEGRLLPLGQRMRRVTEWVNTPRGSEPASAVETG